MASRLAGAWNVIDWSSGHPCELRVGGQVASALQDTYQGKEGCPPSRREEGGRVSLEKGSESVQQKQGATLWQERSRDRLTVYAPRPRATGSPREVAGTPGRVC